MSEATGRLLHQHFGNRRIGGRREHWTDTHDRAILIIVSGMIEDHGMAIMSVREDLEFDTMIQSDCAPLSELVAGLLKVGSVHVFRDPTRGGVASFARSANSQSA